MKAVEIDGIKVVAHWHVFSQVVLECPAALAIKAAEIEIFLRKYLH